MHTRAFPSPAVLRPTLPALLAAGLLLPALLLGGSAAAWTAIPEPFIQGTGTYNVLAAGGNMEDHSGDQITGWAHSTNNWADFGWSNTLPFAGAGAAEFRNPAAAVLPNALALTKSVNVAPNGQFTVSAFVYNGLVGGGTAYIDLNGVFWPNEDGVGDCGAFSTTGYGAWEFVWCSFTVPAATTQATVRLVIEGNPQAGSVVYFDDVAITPSVIFVPPTSTNTDDDGDGFSEIQGDCDNTNALVYPGAPELPDGLDNDCDGFADNGVYDDDGDGYCEDPSFCDDGTQPGDCVDNNAAINPGEQDLCDGIDNDCTGTDDEQDDDDDGFLTCEGDCDDFSTEVFPGNPEVCDEIDNDCDAVIDEGLPRATRYQDLDGDGWGNEAIEESTCLVSDPNWAENAGDCNDENSAIFPGASEFCDEIDNDCDGVIDNGDLCAEDTGCASAPAPS